MPNASTLLYGGVIWSIVAYVVSVYNQVPPPVYYHITRDLCMGSGT